MSQLQKRASQCRLERLEEHAVAGITLATRSDADWTAAFGDQLLMRCTSGVALALHKATTYTYSTIPFLA